MCPNILDNVHSCKCGGKLVVDHVEAKASIDPNGTGNEIVFECNSCKKSYRVAIADVFGVQLFDPDPDFLKGVDSANGKV